MEDEQKPVVIEEENTAASTEQEVQAEEQTEQVEQGQEQSSDIQRTVEHEDVDDRGVPWKNRAMELERKLNEMPNMLQRTVQETLLAQQGKSQEQTKPKYTISELEQYAQENPQYRGWVEEQKAQIIKEDLEKSFDDRLKASERQRNDVQVRQQTEQWVTTHPKFKDCFQTDFSGNKVWNMTNPLTQMMSQILNQQDPVTGKLVKDRPDGLAIAAEMAYGRFMLSSEPKSQSAVKTLQKQLRQTQKQTMIQGGGVNSSNKGMSDYQKHIANYQKTYSKSDATAATKSYLKSIGLLKEEQD